MASPIGTNCKYINIIALNIIYLLADILFYDNFVSQPRSTNTFDTLHYIIADI